MNITNQQRVLMRLLHCGVDDLSLLDDIEYDLDDMIDEMVEDQFLSLDNLLRLVFEEAKREFADAVNQMRDEVIEEYEAEFEEGDSRDEIETIRKLDPIQDFDYYINYLDTHIYLSNYGLYNRYFGTSVELIEQRTGFNVEESMG